MRTKKNDLNKLQEVNGCVMVSAYQLRKEQALCIVKSVLRGVASSIAGQQITCLSLSYSHVLMSATKSMQKGSFPETLITALKDPGFSVLSKNTKGDD
jgi:hypothetical protein